MGIEAALLAATIASTAVAVNNGNKAERAQREASAAATANAEKTAKAADEANNKASAKKPDSAALMSANIAGANGGQASTMLTGPAGIDPSLLTLGKTTLLGGGGKA